MSEIKKVWLLLTFVVSVMLLGCSADEIIRIGTPSYDNGALSVKFENEISDSASITRLRTIILNSKNIEKPNNLDHEPDLFFTLDRPNEGIAEIQRFIWFQDDGRAVLYNEALGYSNLTTKQTIELKNIVGVQ